MKEKLNLTKKIIQKIYRYEEKRTVIILLKYTLIGFLSFAFFLTSLWIVFNILSRQKTLDLLEIFNQDLEIIGNHAGDVLLIFYEELPKEETILAFFFLLILLIVLVIFVRNFHKIKMRISLIRKFRQNG